MSSEKQNLSDYGECPSGKGYKIHIAVSDWNSDITHKLLSGAQKALADNGVNPDDISVLHTPGAFELPVAAKTLLKSKNSDSIICLGCVIKGDTDHDIYINQAVATGIIQLSVISGKPIIFGLLTVNNQEQAEERAGGKHGNKGIEAAITAIKMVHMQKSMGDNKTSIGF